MMDILRNIEATLIKYSYTHYNEGIIVGCHDFYEIAKDVVELLNIKTKKDISQFLKTKGLEVSEVTRLEDDGTWGRLELQDIIFEYITKSQTENLPPKSETKCK